MDEGAQVPDVVNLDADIQNDDAHFEKLIDWTKKGYTYLFDRGFKRIKSLVKIHLSGNFFVTRLHGCISFEVVKKFVFERMRKGDLEIIKDQQVRLGKEKRRTKPFFRLITAISYKNETPKTLYFLTNRFDLTPFEVAELYHFRWEIESLYKWFKSHLKINHFFSYSENGVYLQIYITLIFNLLLLIYHKTQHLDGCLGVNTQRHLFNSICNAILLLGIKFGLQIANQKEQNNNYYNKLLPNNGLLIYYFGIT